ncbi:uncharacterized protein LOC122255607 [Penaeus japonicus]|uniref:uncharacterized protein LOC122255607 n=1 Tax=Penaeus japonicus TaxID=27405 RepID=UPI001C70CAE3|nr:uncharacterized protein LOC122255607 [Penaeus japonicus]XP_042875721.1 uncharacterized protein LOC122255607 [Penaeus japonicus]XP_042875722.1 uncharacterized protein LOC122255607 [Penaeus japonicus]XP_042875723.1 uncharacterized protein LOC122255607 [Penaeus japonicus]XP_042875726.1 uncharacterized protein LOC122255607 [Penaeus japonicus]XP_042875727.1 uncharacterized protein LOC122255607 [Penaeus japonicus]XP_042875728.1 uncharacterized protein LOC122255607 [Penaeus japonicus]
MDRASEFQFSRFDELMLLKTFIAYVIDIALNIETIYKEYKNNGALKEFYLCSFVIPNILAGIKSFQWYWFRYTTNLTNLTEEERKKEEEKKTWIIRFLFFFTSPVTRFWDVYQLGLKERSTVMGGCSKQEAYEAYKKYLEAGTTLYVLRFFELFLMDAPMLTLKMHDYIAEVLMTEETDLKSQVFRVITVLYKLFKMSDVMMSYTTKTKKWWHLENNHKYGVCHIDSVRMGTINTPGKLSLILLHFIQIGCKCLCYAMVGLFPVRWLIYVMIAIRWTVNFCIYFFNRIFNGFGTPVAELSRTVTAFTIGEIELFTHFTVSAGKQLGYILLFHFLDGAEVLTAFFLPFPLSLSADCHADSNATSANATLTTVATSVASVSGMSEAPTTSVSGVEMARYSAAGQYILCNPKILLILLWVLAMLSRAFYYLILHPSLPSLSTYASCCSRKKKREEEEEQGREEEGVALNEIA